MRTADLAPGPPVPGASADELTAGFMVAMATGRQGIAVARKYLTPEAEAAWRPEEHGVQIYDADQNPPITTAESAKIDAPLLGQLDTRGHYEATTSRVRHDFGLIRVGGELRISNPPPGLLLSHYMFTRYFESYPVYFLNSRHNLVPESVHLPTAQVTPEMVLGALLQGPSAWLSPVVVTSIPVKTTLRSVRIDAAGVAYIDFGPEIATLDEETRRNIGAQLAWTMTSFPRVTAISVTTEGAPYKIPGQSDLGILDLANQQGFQVLSRPQSPDLFAVHGGAVGRVVSGSQFRPLLCQLGTSGGVDEIGVSMDGGSIAATDVAGENLWFGQTDGQIKAFATGLKELRKPQVIVDDVWVAGKGDDGASSFAKMNSQGEVSRVDLPIEGNIISYRLDPAGSRIALVTEHNGARRLWLARVEEKDAQTRITAPVPISATVGGVQLRNFDDLGWTGESSLVTLASVPSESRRSAYILNADGATAVPVGPLGDFDLTSISSMPRKSGIAMVATARDGRVLRSDSRGRWQQVTVANISRTIYAG